MKKIRSKVGSWGASSPSTMSAIVPFSSAEDTEHRYRWVIDNKMRCYGEVDLNKRIVRINIARHKRNNEPLIDTLLHEQLHIWFPKLSERGVCVVTECMLARGLTRRLKNRLYARMRRARRANYS